MSLVPTQRGRYPASAAALSPAMLLDSQINLTLGTGTAVDEWSNSAPRLRYDTPIGLDNSGSYPSYSTLVDDATLGVPVVDMAGWQPQLIAYGGDPYTHTDDWSLSLVVARTGSGGLLQSGASRGVYLAVDGAFTVGVGGSTATALTGATTPTGLWQSVILLFDRSTQYVTAFIDGTEASNTYVADLGMFSLAWGTFTLHRVGSGYPSMGCRIAQLGIYERLLDGHDVQLITARHLARYPAILTQ